MLKVTVDADKLTHWATELSERGMRNAIRRAVDKSEKAARKVAVEIIAADIGVPKARIKDAVSKVRRTTQTNLSASFTASKMRVSMLATTGATVNNPGGLTAARFASLAAAARASTSRSVHRQRQWRPICRRSSQQVATADQRRIRRNAKHGIRATRRSRTSSLDKGSE